MAKYQIEYCCGHTDTIQLYGKTSERENYLEWAKDTKLCPECWEAEKQKAREAASQQAAQENTEFGLPPLSGTDKQIAWAETIHKGKTTQIAAAVASYDEKAAKIAADQTTLQKYDEAYQKEDFEDFEHALSCAREAANKIMEETSAHWWIDHRDDDLGQLILSKAKEVAKTRKDSTSMALDAKAEATVRPETTITETVAEITIKEDSIEIHFPEKREDFRELVRFKLGYSWDKNKARWIRRIGIKSGSAQDRAAEAGNKLLAAGFPIRIFDPDIRFRAISGQYEPECHRWIMKRTDNQYAGWFSISWPRGEGFFKAAKKLPGSKYDKPDIVVPAEQFEQVLDFAEMYEFNLSPGAQELADTAHKLRDSVLTAKVERREESAMPEPGKKPKKLAVPEDVKIDQEFKEVMK